MSNPLEAPPPADVQLQSDLITQIQEHTTALCAHFFNFTGALQRDAPPVGLDGDAPPPQPPPTAAQLDTVSKIPQMAEQVGALGLMPLGQGVGACGVQTGLTRKQESGRFQILETHKRIEELIALLPDVSDGEQAQLERIVSLQQQNETASEDLQRELVAAKTQLRDTQDMYAVLADDVLKHQASRRTLHREH